MTKKILSAYDAHCLLFPIVNSRPNLRNVVESDERGKKII